MGTGRMDERDERAVRAFARLLVDQADAFAFSCASAARMSSTRSVRWCRPGPALRHVLRDRRVFGGRLQQLDRGFADRDEVRPHALRRDLLRRLDLQAQRVAIEREGLRQIRNGDADVVQSDAGPEGPATQVAERSGRQAPTSGPAFRLRDDDLVHDRVGIRLPRRNPIQQPLELPRLQHALVRRAGRNGAPGAPARGTRRARGGGRRASRRCGRGSARSPPPARGSLCRWSPRSSRSAAASGPRRRSPARAAPRPTRPCDRRLHGPPC